MPSQNYDLVYRVDTTQAGPQFSAMLAHLRAMASALNNVGVTAVSAGNGMSTFGTQTKAEIQALKDAFTSLSQHAQQHMSLIPPVTENATKSIKGLQASILSIVPTFLLWEQGLALVGKIGEAINSARQHMKDLADEASKVRGELRELANMRNKDEPGDEVVGEVIKFGAQAGMKRDEARRFLEAYEDVKPAGVQRHNVGGGINEGESQKDYEARVEPLNKEISTIGAAYGKRIGLSAETGGKMTGMITAHAKIKDGVQAAEKMAQIDYGLKQGSGRISDLMTGFTNTVASVVEQEGEGVVGSLDDMAILYGLSSQHHGTAAAGTYLKKSTRELRQFGDKQGEGLTEMGITPDDDYLTSLRKVKVRLDKDKANGLKGNDVLRSLQFGDEAGIQAIVEQVNDLALFDVRKAERPKDAGRQLIKDNDHFQKFTMAGKRDKVEAEADAINWIKGRGMEDLQTARLAAMNRMRDSGELNEDGAQWARMARDAGGIMPWMGFPTALQNDVDDNAAKFLQNAVAKASETEPAIGQQWRATMMRQQQDGIFSKDTEHANHEHDLKGMFDTFSPRLRKKEIDPFGPNANAGTDQVHDRMQQGTKTIEKIDARIKADASRFPVAPKPGDKKPQPGGDNPHADQPLHPRGNVSMRGGGVEDLLRSLIEATHQQTDEVRAIASGETYNPGYAAAPFGPARA